MIDDWEKYMFLPVRACLGEFARRQARTQTGKDALDFDLEKIIT